MTALVAMVLLAVASWVLRSALILFVPAQRLPDVVREGLPYLAPAVLGALVVAGLTDAVRGQSAWAVAVTLGSLGLATLMLRLTGRSTLAIGIGVVAALVLDLVPL